LDDGILYLYWALCGTFSTGTYFNFFACKKEGEGGKPENFYGKICIARKRYTTKKKSRILQVGRESRNDYS